mgnify:FL=1
MKYKALADNDGTCLQGYINTTYDNIVSKLGKPHWNGDEYKIDAEWSLLFENGVRATLYNWKNGKNYCGNEGLPVEKITGWHIGGDSIEAVELMTNLLKDIDSKLLESLEDLVGQYQMSKISSKDVIKTLDNIVKFYE